MLIVLRVFFKLMEQEMETQSHSAQLQEFWRRVIARFHLILKLAFQMDSTVFTQEIIQVCQKLQGTRKYFVKRNLVSTRLILQK